jgi:hypothetical protein
MMRGVEEAENVKEVKDMKGEGNTKGVKDDVRKNLG